LCPIKTSSSTNKNELACNLINSTNLEAEASLCVTNWIFKRATMAAILAADSRAQLTALPRQAQIE